ncbi:hypothetical protein OQA88_2142 [Cercophora sp. LCS_1]
MELDADILSFKTCKGGLYLAHEHEAGEADDALIDIVAVHGLNGHCVRTWSRQNDPKSKNPITFWLRDLLPEKMPGARILTFQYESKVLFNRSIGGLSDVAGQLLSKLQAERGDGARHRPIVFLAHSLGGIVVKRALILANEKHNDTSHDIVDATRGIVFFGTPHRGSDVADSLAPLHKITSIGWRKLKLFSTLKMHSEGLLDVSDEFRYIAHRYALITFYEQHIHPMLRDPIVTKTSAIMGIAHEDIMMLGGNHSSMCKFAEKDPRFEAVSRSIQSAAKGPPSRR